MDRNTGVALTSVGVLLIVIGNVLDNDVEVWLSVAGALLTIVGFIIVWRTRQKEPDSD